MRRISLYIALALAPVFAADVPDPGGWTTAKWGMSEAQILAAVPGAVRLDPPDKVNHAAVHMPTYDLAGVAFHVYFVPGSDGKLESVLLNPVGEPAEGFESVYQRLQNLLVEKYGRPWNSTEGSTHEMQWSRPTTTIALSLIRLPAIKMAMLHLQYKLRSTELDKM